jgi:hypothetical protein
MSIDKLLEEIEEKTDLKICAVCGMPSKPYHCRQKTCGDPECKRQYKNSYTKGYVARLKAEDIDAYRAYRADAQKRSRQKKRMEARARELSDEWDRPKAPIEDGLNYGRRSAEKVLSKVPKINVNLEGSDESEIRNDTL